MDELLGTGNINLAAEKLAEPGSRPFLCALLARLNKLEPPVSEVENTQKQGQNDANNEIPLSTSNPTSAPKTTGNGPKFWHGTTTLEVLRRVRTLRADHLRKMRSARTAFWVVLEVRGCLVSAGVIKASGDRGDRGGNGGGIMRDYMSACFRGTLAGREGKTLASGIR